MTGSARLPARAGVPFVEAVADLMRVRRMGVRQLARAAGASPSHLSRALRGAQDKQPSVALLERLATALGVAPDYFLEIRRSHVIARLGDDPALVDELYDRP